MRNLGTLLLACAVTACGAPSAPAPSSPATTTAAAPDRVSGAQAHDLVKGGATLVDVRSPEEYAAKHIDGAVNVPVEGVVAHDFGGKDKPLVLYCAAGHRSARAAEELKSQGYTRVYLLGAMSAWGEESDAGR